MKESRRVKTKILIVVVALLALALLAACASKQADQESSDSGADTTQTEAKLPAWTVNSDCASCHATEAKSVEDTMMLAAAHANAGVKCVSCHTDEAALKSAHDGVLATSPMPTELSKTTVDEKTCLSSACHNTTLAELAKKTAGSTVLTDINGTVVNPHLAPTLTQAHVDAKMTCTNCHSMHAKSDPMAMCVNCHHMNVFVCNTCHE